jgi:hypothetical protein
MDWFSFFTFGVGRQILRKRFNLDWPNSEKKPGECYEKNLADGQKAVKTTGKISLSVIPVRVRIAVNE